MKPTTLEQLLVLQKQVSDLLPQLFAEYANDTETTIKVKALYEKLTHVDMIIDSILEY